MILCKEYITKVLIRLRGCTDWSLPLMFVNPEDRFSGVEAHIISGAAITSAAYINAL